MKTILEQKGNLKEKKVLLRLDLNTPIVNGEVADNFRIKKILPTIEFLKKEGARIIILSHIGQDTDSLMPVYSYLRKFFEVKFVKDIWGDEASIAVSDMRDGDIIMFENLRKDDGEKNNDLKFARHLSSFGDIYVNDAFSISHRKHTSIVGLPVLMKSYFGLLFERECEELERISKSARPKLFVLGGNKGETKLPFVKKFLENEQADFIFVGGSLANEFFKMKGLVVGKSLVSDKDLGLNELLDNPKIILPADVVVENSRQVFIKKPNEVLKDEIIVDAGPETILQLRELIGKSKFVLWNGPMGDYTKGFIDSTFEFIKIVAESNIESVAGGGDTVFCISKTGLKDKFDFLSTGGGAMLEFIATGTLVGIEAIKLKTEK
ncbi:MAG: phosphoglycerate kinase [Patescibacteria group bacterium]